MKKKSTYLTDGASKVFNIFAGGVKRIALGLCMLSTIATICSLTSCSDPAQEALQKQQAETAAYKTAITSILAQDAHIKQESPKNILYHVDDSVKGAKMRKLDMSRCPRDFAEAYLNHIHAWDESASIQQALNSLHKEGLEGPVVMTVLQNIIGLDQNALKDAFEAERKLNNAKQDASRRINETFNEVERIAVAYGATLP